MKVRILIIIIITHIIVEVFKKDDMYLKNKNKNVCFNMYLLECIWINICIYIYIYTCLYSDWRPGIGPGRGRA